MSVTVPLTLIIRYSDHHVDAQRRQTHNARWPRCAVAGNASSAKDVQSFVLDGFTNDVMRLTEDILPVFMGSSPETPKVRLHGSQHGTQC